MKADETIEIRHDKDEHRFYTIVDGNTAHVAYRIYDGVLDIRHTIVPEAIEGRGIASALVRKAYDYAREEGLKPAATCRYAVTWLERHPEYNGHPGKDWCPDGSCGI